MGIKFRCPSGHKLNVKSFLSGKRAICPKCGAKVVVPSTEGAVVGGANTPSRDLPPDNATAASSFHRDQDAWAADANGDAQHGARRVGNQESAPARDLAKRDPLADEQAQWYVRPPSGGQYGPAPALLFRDWLAEGRITADTLIWRTGWPEWQMASVVFPRLAIAIGQSAATPRAAQRAAQTSAELPPEVAGLPGGPTAPTSASRPATTRFVRVADEADDDPALRQRLRRQRDQRNMILASVILFIIVVVLFIALIVVLNNRQSQSESTQSMRIGATSRLVMARTAFHRRMS